MTPEEAIETGVYNRLTDGTVGLTVAAGKYCADQGGIQYYHGQVDLTVESLSQWAFAGAVEGPLVLIVVGGSVDYASDKAQFVAGEYGILIYICAGSWRTTHEAEVGDAGSDSRGPGIWQVKSDILDCLLNHVVVTEASPPWVVRGRRVATQGALVLYEITMGIEVATLHNLTPWSALDDLTHIRSTIQKEPDAGAGEEFQVGVGSDYP